MSLIVRVSNADNRMVSLLIVVVLVGTGFSIVTVSYLTMVSGALEGVKELRRSDPQRHPPMKLIRHIKRIMTNNGHPFITLLNFLKSIIAINNYPFVA